MSKRPTWADLAAHLAKRWGCEHLLWTNRPKLAPVSPQKPPERDHEAEDDALAGGSWPWR